MGEGGKGCGKVLEEKVAKRIFGFPIVRVQYALMAFENGVWKMVENLNKNVIKR